MCYRASAPAPKPAQSPGIQPTWNPQGRLSVLTYRVAPRLPLAHPRPPSHSHGPPPSPPRPRPHRSTQPRGGWQALLASPALRLLPGNGQLALAALLARPPPAALPPAGTLSSAPAPPARLRSPVTPRRPSPRLARQGGAACPRRFCALRPWPGHTCLPPARDTCLPAFLLASEHRSSWHQSVPGRVLLWGGSRSPTCPCSPPTGARPAPPTFPGEAAARAGAKPFDLYLHFKKLVLARNKHTSESRSWEGSNQASGCLPPCPSFLPGALPFAPALQSHTLSLPPGIPTRC